jgi:tRNA(Ile)-lysidine synthase TilS/MesJ
MPIMRLRGSWVKPSINTIDEEGDHILVSVSGGKDSMSLLWLIQERLARLQ